MARERASEIERLTVLGVDPHDARASAELWRFVPEDADAVYRPRYSTPGAGRTLRAAVRNPPVTAVVLASLAYRSLRSGDDPPATGTASEIASRAGDETLLDVDPLDGVFDQGAWWTLGAWIATLSTAAAVVALVLGPATVTVLFALVVAPLVASYVLAHGGAQIQRRDRTIFDALRAHAARRGHDRPVVIVRERHVPGVADRAKDALVETDARRVSTELAVDESLY